MDERKETSHNEKNDLGAGTEGAEEGRKCH